jgi:hypothetical protein
MNYPSVAGPQDQQRPLDSYKFLKGIPAKGKNRYVIKYKRNMITNKSNAMFIQPELKYNRYVFINLKFQTLVTAKKDTYSIQV